jgi:PKD repeat protein
MVVGFMVLAAVLAVFSLNSAAAVNSPQESSTSNGQLAVIFNSVQLDTMSPQAYAFGVAAQAAQGFTITRLHWDFGDGINLDVPYCCQSQVSEVRYHAYQQPGTYTVTVTAYDSGGNMGDAATTISWPTPVPEFQTATLPLLLFMLTIVYATLLRKKARSSSTRP